MATALSPLLDALRQFKLLTSAQLKELDNLPSSISDPKALARELIQRGWLTSYQANLLLQGKGQELLLGSYVLLERLGEGGMGEVFKARNWKLGKVVALKLIHKERVANPDAVKRFQREVRAAAQLSHPNVVMAYDADEVGGTHLLVMEYVEGSDLAGVVKRQGRLPVEQACDFIRQAALALQHAFEKGLVHRDIKPANLLLAKGSVVKILDMGLARHDSAEDKSSTMTQEGSVMGTPDYIAPEQAMDSHTVDIRGDIYSLGCTLYFLLTGCVPFPGGTMMEKLLKHRLQEPTPVEQLRPGVPSGVLAVVRKMMAKTPEDRYQTPGDVAAALTALGSGGAPVQYPDERTMAEGGVAQRATPVAVGETSDSMEARVASQRQRRETEQRRWRRLTLVGGVLLLGAVAVFVGLLFWQRSPPQEAKTTAGSPPIVEKPRDTKKVDDAWVKQVAAMPAGKQVDAVVAKLKELNRDFDGKLLTSPKIENGVVTGLRFVTDNVNDISPLRALTGLKELWCGGSALGKGKLFDLSPLKGLPLTFLICEYTPVFDLSPLKNMQLTDLHCGYTQVSDLSPLKGMPLTYLQCHGTKVTDLSPLRGMPLTYLNFGSTPAADLSPLKDMKLTYLACDSTPVSDLSPLKGMPLTNLLFGNTKVADLSPLKDMKLTALECGFTQVSDLSPLKDMKLTALECRFTQVPDLSPLKDMKLTVLHCNNTPVSDLSPLKGMPLTTLACYGTQVGDLSPLKGMPLTNLKCSTTPVTDLTPLKDMKLTTLWCSTTQVADLSPLKGMPLTNLWCYATPVADLSPLKGMPLEDIRLTPRNITKGMDVLRPMKTLKTIGIGYKENDKWPADEFWKKFNAEEFK